MDTRNSRKFYVYVLFRPDGTPCYVGKGQGDRWLDMRRRKYNNHLFGIIKAAGGVIPTVKVRDNLTENEAYDTEIALIAAIGREKHGGPLVNMTDGGIWFDGLTSSQRERLRAVALARARVAEEKRAMEALSRRAAKAKQKALRQSEWQRRLRKERVRAHNRKMWRENRPHV